jgi:methyl-accepting chemotaxis protein
LVEENQTQAEIGRLRDGLSLRDKSITQLQQTIVGMRQKEKELSDQLNHYKMLAEQLHGIVERQDQELTTTRSQLEHNYKALQALQNSRTVKISQRVISIIRRK